MQASDGIIDHLSMIKSRMRIIFRFAQSADIPTAQELTRAKQTAAIVNDRANTIYDDVQSYVTAGQMRPDAVGRANNLKNAAGQLAIAFNQQTLPENVSELGEQTKSAFDQLENTFMPREWAIENDYRPFIELEEGLTLVLNYLEKLSNLPAPPPEAA